MMKETTRKNLTRYFMQANKGLDQELDCNFEEIWFPEGEE
jgi:hypothetical protein